MATIQKPSYFIQFIPALFTVDMYIYSVLIKNFQRDAKFLYKLYTFIFF